MTIVTVGLLGLALVGCVSVTAQNPAVAPASGGSIGVLAHQSGGDTTSALFREIKARNVAMEVAFNRGDLLGVSRFYTDDARIVSRNGTVDAEGRVALDRYWAGIRGGKSWRLDVLGVGGTPDAPYQVGRSTLVFDPGTGERTAVTHFLVLWRREASGELRIFLDYYH